MRDGDDKEAYASLRVFGECLDPIVVTDALRLPADHTHRKGEPHLRRRPSGEVREYAPLAQGMWRMSSQDQVDSTRLSEHIDWLLREVEPKADALRSLLVRSVQADIFCYSYGANPCSPSVPQALRERASALGLKIEVDHWQEPADDELADESAEDD